jgi:hypothetical protein
MYVIILLLVVDIIKHYKTTCSVVLLTDCELCNYEHYVSNSFVVICIDVLRRYSQFTPHYN